VSSAPPPELDRGSYLSTYGLLNPWTLWLLAHEPELVGLRPSELHQASVAPRCPDPLCRRAMQMRAHVWRCYYHEPPRSLPPGFQAPKVKWTKGPPDVLALVGRDDVDVVWQEKRDNRPEGYVIVFRKPRR
jgi:hypothetical protein